MTNAQQIIQRARNQELRRIAEILLGCGLEWDDPHQIAEVADEIIYGRRELLGPIVAKGNRQIADLPAIDVTWFVLFWAIAHVLMPAVRLADWLSRKDDDNQRPRYV